MTRRDTEDLEERGEQLVARLISMADWLMDAAHQLQDLAGEIRTEPERNDR